MMFVKQTKVEQEATEYMRKVFKGMWEIRKIRNLDLTEREKEKIIKLEQAERMEALKEARKYNKGDEVVVWLQDERIAVIRKLHVDPEWGRLVITVEGKTYGVYPEDWEGLTVFVATEVVKPKWLIEGVQA